MLFPKRTIQPIRERGVKEHLDQDWDGQQRNDQRLPDDRLALKRKEQYQRG